MPCIPVEHTNSNCVNLAKLLYCLHLPQWRSVSVGVSRDWRTERKRGSSQREREMVKSLIAGNLIHLVVLETASPGRQSLGLHVCHPLFVFVGVIHVPRGRLSVASLHDHIPSDPGHYGSIQQHWSLLTWVSLLASLTFWAHGWAWLNSLTNPHLKDWRHS